MRTSFRKFLTDWLAGLLAGWLAGWLDGWLAGWLTDFPKDLFLKQPENVMIDLLGGVIVLDINIYVNTTKLWLILKIEPFILVTFRVNLPRN